MGKPNDLTDANLRKLRSNPPDTRIELTSRTTKGLRCRISPDGTGTFSIMFRSGGTGPVRRLNLGSWPALALSDAVAKAEQVRGQISGGEDPHAARKAAKAKADADRASTFAALVEWYTAKGDPNRKAMEYIRRLPAAWDDRPAGSLTRKDIIGALDAFESKTSRNRIQGALCAMINAALEDEWGGLTANPISGMKMRGGKEAPRTRFFADAELKLWWSVMARSDMDPVILGASQLCILLAQRPAEIAGMVRSELHLDHPQPYWLIPEARRQKGGENALPGPHLVPLGPRAVEIIRAQLDAPGRWLPGHRPRPDNAVFGSKFASRATLARASVGQRWNAMQTSLVPDSFADDADHSAAISLQADRVKPNDSRTLLTSTAPRLGFTTEIADRVLGHAITGISRFYQWHDFRQEKTDLIIAYERFVLQVVGELQPAPNVLPMKRQR